MQVVQHMEPEADYHSDAPSSPSRPKRKRRHWTEHRRSRPQLILRSELDGRTNAAKYFDRLVTAIESDLAGADQLSAIEKVLVEAYAGAAVTLQHMNAQLALGQPINIGEHSSCVGALVRVASRLGLGRRAKTVTTFSDLLRQDAVNQQREASARREQQQREFERRQSTIIEQE